ncbi:GNAT family N-acetyltransferase [Lewinella sp. 4G2]|uniref:GNAT family N-acetyltransferase n=1 Tax=Lewinella sp. 4G2 TaxID=1803372 RepID=UPI001E30C22D|nr:GNAT family N-acetyltransferase [Lewinella sp. 4G2]
MIRRFREHEGAQLFDLVRDSQDYLHEQYPDLPRAVGENAKQAEGFVRRRIADWLLQQNFTFGVWDNESTELIGYLQVRDVNWSVPAASLDFFLHPAQKEGGYTVEVLARMLRFAFRQLGLEKLNYYVLSDNFAAQRAARKVGFKREGDLRNQFRKGSGFLADLMCFGLSRETYGE